MGPRFGRGIPLPAIAASAFSDMDRLFDGVDIPVVQKRAPDKKNGACRSRPSATDG